MDLADSFHIFRGFDIEAGIGIDEAQVIMHLLHAAYIFCRNDGSLARIGVDDQAVQLDDAIADGYLQPDGPPIRLRDRIRDPFLNVIVICRRIGHIARQTRYRLL